MLISDKYRVIKAGEVALQKGHCGTIKVLSEEPVEINHLVVNAAIEHYHKLSTEYYYVINGSGTIFLDNVPYEIEKGDLVKIAAGTKHKAVGELEILVIASPPAKGDRHY